MAFNDHIEEELNKKLEADNNTRPVQADHVY